MCISVRDELCCTYIASTLTGSKFVSIGPIYYEYGSMVITFDNSESALNALDQLKGSKTEYEGGKKILGESVNDTV